MAGGNNNKTKEEGILVQARLNQSLRCCNRIHRECKVIKNKNVKNQILQQSKLLYQRHVDLLQEDIEKIFNESLHCDLKLIHGCKVVYTHQCIIRSRSPWFYNVLRPYISFKNNTAHCYIKQLGIYQQFKNFVRLLYTNSDISHYERFLIQLLVNTTCPVFEHTCESSQREFIRNKAFNYYMNCCSYGNVIEKGVNDKSPTSDMADSGVESGSVVSPHETISENSSTDLDEPNESSSKNHEISRTRGSSILNERNHNRSDSSREQVSDEYESRVLGDPYYESVDESDDEQANSYLPTASFKYPEQNSSFLSSANVKKHDDKITQNGRKPNITIEQHIDINTSSSNSNYYFIDASSLNDDIDVATTNVVGYPNDLNGRLNWSNPPMPNSCYIPTSRSNNFFRNDDTYKLPNRTSVNAQNRYEEVQYNQDSDYSETFSDSQKLQKFESLAIQDDLNSCKSNNKESLVVEIKEADSGESAQHSPCPDNTKVDNIQKVQDRLVNIEPEQQESEEQDEEPESKPVLIRRNTFELDANDEKLSSLRQEYERRQGSLVFQNSITQYSQHRIDGDPFYDPAIEPDSFANNLDINTNSEIAIDAPKDFVSDKYDLDSSEKENKSCRLLSNVDNESAIHSISRSASDKWLANCETDEDDISFNSLPVHINNDFSMSQVRSKLRRNEAAPIVSGGASSSDFQKPTDSPIVKRKTESTPIVSGGSVIIPEPDIKEKSKVKSSNMSSSMTAWVVDISDCRTSSIEKKVKQPQVSMSSSFSHMTSADKWGTEKDKEKDKQPSSLGYFVNLDDIKSPNENSKEGINKHRRRPSDSVTSEKNYCEFFIDISDNKPARRRSIDKSIEKSNEKMVNKKIESLVSPLATRVSMTSSQPSDSKKNIFSMFIDLNDPKLKPKSKTESEEMPRASSVTKSSSSSKLSDKQRFEPTECGVTEDQSNEERKPKSGVFMFIESDSPLVRRRTLSSSRPAFKRHSWNTDKSQEQQSPTTVNEQQTTIVPKRVHKRAHSLSVDRVGDFRKFITCRSSNSSHSLNEAANKVDLNGQQALPEQKEQSVIQEQKSEQKDETYDYDIRDTPPNSHVEILNEELLVSLKNRNYQELDSINEHTAKETNEANDTKTKTKPDDCYSESSVWEKTPTEESTETNERRKSETFDITISSSASGPSSTSDNLDYKLAELLDPTQQKSTMNLKSAKNHQDNKLNLQNHEKVKSNSAKSTMPASFVRLSDLDKRPLSTSATGIITAKSYENSYRLSNSVTETSWIESKLVGSARTNEPLHKTLNKRLSLSIATGAIKSENYDEFNTEGDAEAVISESDLSSLRSSMGRSAEGSTEETETSSFAMGKPYNRLGEDLLRMFLEEINPDVTIDVGGRRIKAHKCILSSRCQYFAAILSGGWIESAGNIISLQGYSYNAVHFALCHIYSGESCIPDTISIVELATLADMLCLEGLKEVIGFTLKVKYCHLFHKPCNGCAVGVLECMPLAAAYGLDEVYRKSLRWVTRHFVRIWPTKEFATLPRELMDKCYHQHIVYMCADNVLQTIMDCDKLLTTLPNVRWAEPVFRLVSNLLDASMKYLTDNYAGILGNENFQNLDRELTWNISRLEDHLLAAAERLPPEQACKAYSKLDKLFDFTHTEETQHTTKWSPLFSSLMNKIRGQVEKCLVRDAARAARTNAWLKMDLELRRRIQELACLVILPNEGPNKRPSRHSNFLKEPKERQEVKMPTNRAPPNKNLIDLRKIKVAISEHNDKTLRQTPLLQTRKIMNKPKTDPLERKLQNEKLSNDIIIRPKSSKTEVKSRYLEPRNRPVTKESVQQINQEKTLGQQRRKIMISSSDSSRTSSPAMKRAAERKAISKISKVPVKKDGRALSSDSLTESNSRLNMKKEVASKSLGITRPESPLLKIAKDIEAGLSIDSLADPKKKTLIKKTGKMDTSMSTDSLMTDTTTITTPKSMTTNKSSPILGKTNSNLSQTRIYDKFKKSSPPTQQRSSNISVTTPTAMRRPARSLESSTAASRSRAAAVVNTYGSLNLRKSLLDAAKAPDIPNRALNSPAMTRSTLRQSYSMRSSFAISKNDKSDKKDESTNNQRTSTSPLSKRSPKSNVNSRLSKSNIVSNKQKANNKPDDKSSNKTKSQTTGNQDGPKFLNQSSRSGTFLKDEPTILKKSDIETAAIDV